MSNAIPAEINPKGYGHILDMLEDAVATYGDKPAYTSILQTFTYAQFGQMVDDFSSYLASLEGLEPGDRVMVQMPNLMAAPVTFLSIWKAGFVPVPANPLYTAREIRNVIEDSGAKAIIAFRSATFTDETLAGTGIIHRIAVARTDCHPAPKKWIVDLALQLRKTPPLGDLPTGAVGFREAMKRGRGLPTPNAERASDQLALLQYTGGTTGTPKGVMLTQANIISNAMQNLAHAPNSFEYGTETMVGCLPMYHIMPLYAHILLPFAIGAHTLLIADPRNNATFVAALKSTPFTIFVGIHTLFNNLLGDEAFRELDFSKLKFSTSGGMALPKATAERWQEVTGAPVTEGYGLSETSPVLTANPLEAIQLGTVGTKLPLTEIRIIKDDGTEAGVEEPGELQARGPQVMRGYWNRPDATAEVMTDDGFFKTGDVAVIQEDGYYRIVDRIKDLINVSGFNVFPAEIEDVLAGLDGVLECGVVGVMGDKDIEQVKVCVVRDPDSAATVDADDVVAFAKANLAAYKVPKIVEFIDELPKSAVGKILRRELR